MSIHAYLACDAAHLTCASNAYQHSNQRCPYAWLTLSGCVHRTHILTLTPHTQGWDALSQYPHIVKFLDAMKGRDSWGPSAPVNDEAVVKGWNHKLEKLKSS